MTNNIPTSIEPLFALATSAADGLQAIGAAVGITQNTEQVVRTDLGAARTARNAYDTNASARTESLGDQHNADQEARTFISLARKALVPFLGVHYTNSWKEAGYPPHSTGVPSKMSVRLEVVNKLQTYLTAHVPYQSATLGVTPDHAGEIADDLTAAISGVNSATTLSKTSKTARDAAVSALRTRLRKLVRELSNHLGPMDPRWETFGFNMPGDDRTPAVPGGLAVTDGVVGHLAAGWERTPRAERFHVFTRVMGVQDDFVLSKVTSELSADLNTFQPGQHVLVRLTAVNSKGESPACEPVEHVVP